MTSLAVDNGVRDVMEISDGNPFAYIAGRPISLILVALIALTTYLVLKPKAWEAGAPKEAAVARRVP